MKRVLLALVVLSMFAVTFPGGLAAADVPALQISVAQTTMVAGHEMSIAFNTLSTRDLGDIRVELQGSGQSTWLAIQCTSLTEEKCYALAPVAGSYLVRERIVANAQFPELVSNSVAIEVQAEDQVYVITDLMPTKASIYPLAAGYADSVNFAAAPGEDVSVLALVRNKTGKIVRSYPKVIYTWGTGGWWLNWTWNGRTSSGTLLPEGTYTFELQYLDTIGNRLTQKATVVLSLKKLIWKTYSATLVGNAYAEGVPTGDGTVSKSASYPSGVALYGGSSNSSSASVYYPLLAVPTGVRYSSLSLTISGTPRPGESPARPCLFNHNSNGGAFGSGDICNGNPSATARSWTVKVSGDAAVRDSFDGAHRVEAYISAQGWAQSAVDVVTIQISLNYAVLGY